MDIKYKRKEYPDFILRMSPLITGLFELILKKQTGIKISDYTRTSSNGDTKWIPSKLAGTEVLNVLNSNYSNFYDKDHIKSDHLKTLLHHYCADTVLNTLISNIRNIESNLRNKTAHQMVSITETTISTYTGYTGRQIMEMVKALFTYAGINVRRDDWESYERLNDEIVRRMEEGL